MPSAVIILPSPKQERCNKTGQGYHLCQQEQQTPTHAMHRPPNQQLRSPFLLENQLNILLSFNNLMRSAILPPEILIRNPQPIKRRHKRRIDKLALRHHPS